MKKALFISLFSFFVLSFNASAYTLEATAPSTFVLHQRMNIIDAWEESVRVKPATPVVVEVQPKVLHYVLEGVSTGMFEYHAPHYSFMDY